MGDDLLGREAELDTVRRAARSAARGDGGLLLFTGPPGIGRTALLGAACRVVRAEGLRAVRGGGVPLHRGVPLATLLATYEPGSGRAAPGSGGGPAGAAAPLADGPDLDATAPLADGFALDAAAARILGAWRRGGPTAVLLDDLHLADDDTLRVLHLLTGRLKTAPVLGVATARIGHARLAPVLDGARVRSLAGLGAGDAAELARRAVREGGDRHSGRGAGPLSGAGGNPRYVLAAAAGQLAGPALRLMSELPEPGAALLRTAALLGDGSEVEELAAALGRPGTEVLGTVTALLAQELLVPHGRGVAVVPRALAAGLREVFGPLFGQLNALSLAAGPVAPARIAQLLDRDPAPLGAPARRWLLGNARTVAAGEPELAVRLLRRWLSVPVSPREAVAEARSALAEALLWSGRPVEAEREARSALRVHESAALRTTVAMARMTAADAGSGFAVLEPRLARDERLLGPAALCLTMAGDLPGAERLIKRSVGSRDSGVLAHVLHARAVHGCLNGDRSAAAGQLAEARHLLERELPDPGLTALNSLLRLVCSDGEAERLRIDAEAEPLVRRLGGLWLSWFAMESALTATGAGRWDLARALLQTALTRRELYGMAGPLYGLGAQLALQQGDMPSFRRQASAAAAQRAGLRGAAVLYRGVPALAEALLAEADGRTGEALALVRGLLGDANASLPHHCVPAAAAVLVRLCHSAGDRELARALARTVRDGAAAGPEPGGAEEGGVALAVAAGGFARAGASGELPYSSAVLGVEGLGAGEREGRSRPVSGWESLTPAQRRVAEFVAEGCTNPETARRLFVSPRTVQSHVSQILRKLGLSSRVEIAVEVARRRD
ncbi:helix-turn-helix transcriptional regulator [Streptomyces sp. SCSIO ZS0520]|uniref:helix-turn-helix transcriptional regulator n=1 Tax=Streptomyces sp. SCSIO ZS0520 TaxID=2892996 RepID=UPI0021DB4F4B|nr:LuxR family transcriptional regulator [Streptomyces sp. SCSIO ZS0520]